MFTTNEDLLLSCTRVSCTSWINAVTSKNWLLSRLTLPATVAVGAGCTALPGAPMQGFIFVFDKSTTVFCGQLTYAAFASSTKPTFDIRNRASGLNAFTAFWYAVPFCEVFLNCAWQYWPGFSASTRVQTKLVPSRGLPCHV